jgi:Ca2+-transporting ATPase
MGITGTEVAKESSDIVLLDDNFATIVNTIKEGRRIFDNIKKFIKYTLTSNLGEIITIIVAPLLGLPIPLLPIHILWINLVTDGLPGLAFSEEIPEKDIMKRKPRNPQDDIFSEGLGLHIIWVGFTMAMITILSQYIALKTDFLKEKWQTVVFTVLCFSQLGHALAIRHLQKNF